MNLPAYKLLDSILRNSSIKLAVSKHCYINFWCLKLFASVKSRKNKSHPREEGLSYCRHPEDCRGKVTIRIEMKLFTVSHWSEGVNGSSRMVKNDFLLHISIVRLQLRWSRRKNPQRISVDTPPVFSSSPPRFAKTLKMFTTEPFFTTLLEAC